MSVKAAICKIEKTTHNGETIYNFFCRDESLRRHHVSVYDYYPYFYVPETTPVIKHPDLIKVEKGNFKDLDGKPVKKIYMRNWNTINPYDELSYHKKYRKSYEVDVDQENRIAIDLGIKSGFEFKNDIIRYNIDHIKPIDCKVNLRRLHVDYEVSTEITKKIPTYKYPVEPMYTLANFDNYTQKFVIFIQHIDYKNKTYINTTYRPPIKKALKEKIKELKDKLAKLRIQYKECIDIELNIIEMNKEQLVENGDYVIYLFKRFKFEKELKSFISRLKAVKNQFKDTYPVKIVMYNNEVDMYKRYIKYIKDIDPDIITGWNSQGFDIPYLIERMKEVGVKPNELSPIRSVYINKSQDIGKIKGRIVFDSWKGFKKQQTHLLESYTLDFVSEYLFNIGKVKHDGIDNMYHNNKKLLIKYNLQDVFLEFAIFENQGIFEFFYDVKCYAGCSFEDVLDNSHIVDTYCLFRAKNLNLVLPNKPAIVSSESFEGAPIPFPPKKKGIQQYIAVIDLKSLYPNIMRTLNIGADTIVENPSKEMIPHLIRSPINGLYFRKDKKSFIGGISEELLEYRLIVQNEMKAAFNSGNLALFDLKKRLQTVIKFITNSIWGVIGWNRFRLYHRKSAACITATARLVIQFSGKIAAKKGFIPYYGDTDSVFLMMKPKPIIEIKHDMIDLAAFINNKYEIFKKIFNVDVHYFKMIAEKLFKHCFMVEKKTTTKITKPEDVIARKRYVGWLIWNDDLKLEESCNELSITGFDRSDMSRIGNKTMKEVLMLSASGITSKVQEYLKETVNNIKKKKYPLEDVAFSKGISKPLDEYERFYDWIEGAKWTNYHSGLWGGLTNYGTMSKPKYVYVTKTKVPTHYAKIPNNHKFMVIALDENNSLPDELIKAINWKVLVEKTIRDKILKILEAANIDWSSIFDYEGYTNLLRC